MVIKVPLAQVPDPGGAHGPALRAHILVVEDHADSREMLRRLLVLEGYDVSVAEDGRQAMAAAAAHPPLIALIDLGLPGIDGLEVARAIRDRFGRKVWLVALTGRTKPADRRGSSEAGFDLHVVKPVAPDRLRGIVRDIVSLASS